MASNSSGDVDLDWQRYGAQTAPRSFWTAWAAAVSTAALGHLLFVPLLLTVGARVGQLVRLRVRSDSKTWRLVFRMFVNVGLCSVCNAVQLASTVLFFTASDSAGAQQSRCHAVQKVGIVLYGCASASVYWFLLARAEVTLDRRSFWHMTVYRLCKLGLVVGVPGLMISSAILFEGRVMFGWACTLEMSPAIAAVFLLLDLGLSVMLLLLFYIPVRKHLVEFKYSHSDAVRKQAKRIHDRALRILRLSLVQVLSTLVVQLVGLATLVNHSDADAPETAFWRHVRFVLYAVDLWANTGCMLAMTTAWVPDGWTRLKTALRHIRRAGTPCGSAAAVTPATGLSSP